MLYRPGITLGYFWIEAVRSSSNPNSMILAPVKEQEIDVIIQSLNPKNSIGPYSIPAFLSKILSKYLAKPLSQIVNLSFEFGIFPDNSKIG